MQVLKEHFFICLCIWLVGAFSDLLAFGSVKIVKVESPEGGFERRK